MGEAAVMDFINLEIHTLAQSDVDMAPLIGKNHDVRGCTFLAPGHSFSHL